MMGKIWRYWNEPISREAKLLQDHFANGPYARKVVVPTVLGLLAVLFQSMGGFLPGLGYFISPFATTPIIFSSLISFRFGLMSYMLAACLLLVVRPDEVIIFIFATGLLGIGVGGGFFYARVRWTVTLLGSLSLFTGLICLLFILQFPVLGSAISSDLRSIHLTGLFAFTLLYSWIWVAGISCLLKRMNHASGISSHG